VQIYWEKGETVESSAASNHTRLFDLASTRYVCVAMHGEIEYSKMVCLQPRRAVGLPETTKMSVRAVERDRNVKSVFMLFLYDCTSPD
jgi:hypothetical protein